MHESTCPSYAPTSSGACSHYAEPGLCSKAVAPICVNYLLNRPPLSCALDMCTGQDSHKALARKIASSARVALHVRHVEVAGKGKIARICSLGFDDGAVQCVDPFDENSPDEVLQALAVPLIVGVNLKDAMIALASMLPKEPSLLLDLGLVSRALEAGRESTSHHLSALLQRHLGIEENPVIGELRWTGLLTRVHVLAASKQVTHLLSLADAMLEEVQLRGLQQVVDLEHRVLPVTVEMEVRGLPVNESLWFQTVGELEVTRLRVQRRLWHAEAKLDSIGAEQLRVEVNSMRHILGGFVQSVSTSLGKSDDARVRGSLQQCGTVTGRYTCVDPPLLSMPKQYGLRRCFEAPSNLVLLRADFSCFELRVAAALSRDPTMLDIFQYGGDAHRLIAAYLLEKEPDEVTPDERRRIKPVSFGTIYGMTAGGLVELARNEYQVDMSLDEATEYQRAYFRRFAGLARWREAIVADKASISSTRLGRVRHWPPAYDRDGARLAFPVQAGAADVMKACVAALAGPLRLLDAAILLVVHDELIVECASSVASVVKVLLRETMCATAARLFPEVSFAVNLSEGKSLGEQTHD